MTNPEESIRQSKPAEVDLTNCDREPIHVPGSIQPHGVMLSLDEPGLRVLQVSANCGEFLGIDATELLGNPLSLLLETSQTNSVREALGNKDLRTVNPLKLEAGFGVLKRQMNGILHRHQGVLFLELEPLGDPASASMRAFQILQTALRKIEKTTTLPELWSAVAEEVQGILGYERVMIYKFDRAGNGAVIEEKVVNGKDSYLGLNYPASDIPQQARLLYSQNYIRHIADASYKAAELIPLIYPLTRDLTDLSYSTLRSVSPLHIEYLHNMGVASSLSISIMAGSSLWGLIACHHHSPKFVPFELRAACEVLGQVVSSRMFALESTAQSEYATASNLLKSKFLQALSQTTDLKAALVDGSPKLLDYVPSGGAALCLDGECSCMGKTPSSEQLTALFRRLRRFASPVFATDDLHSAFPEAAEYKDVASGLLSVAISREKEIYLLWFRPEQVQTVRWAGNPHKSVDERVDGRLHPRKSFELWKEELKFKSHPWLRAEIQSATELRSTIMGLLLNRGRNKP